MPGVRFREYSLGEEGMTEKHIPEVTAWLEKTMGDIPIDYDVYDKQFGWSLGWEQMGEIERFSMTSAHGDFRQWNEMELVSDVASGSSAMELIILLRSISGECMSMSLTVSPQTHTVLSYEANNGRRPE